MKNIKYDLKPAWKLLKISMVLQVVYLICYLVSIFLQTAIYRVMLREQQHYSYYPCFLIGSVVLVFLIYVGLFLSLKKKILKGTALTRSDSIFNVLFGISFFVIINPVASSLQLQYDQHHTYGEGVDYVIVNYLFQSSAIIKYMLSFISVIQVASIMLLMISFAMLWYHNYLGINNKCTTDY